MEIGVVMATTRPKFWSPTADLADHIDSHNSAIASTIVYPAYLGTQSADFTTAIYIPRYKLTYVGAGLVVNTTITTSTTAYWTIQIYQLIDGRERLLGELITNTRNITQYELTNINKDQDISVNAEYPVFIKGTKTGAPSNLVNLYCDILIRLQ